GRISIVVNGWSTSVSYSSSSPATLATSLKNALNVAASPVTATSSGSTVTMTAKAAGSQSNYAVTSSTITLLPGYFSWPSFSLSPASFSLSGGTDVPPAAPSNIVATPSVNALPVVVTWTDNSNIEINFVVERCTGSGCSTFSVLSSTIPLNTT